MMRAVALLAALGLALPATPADALSCRRPDVARSYQMADAAPDTYIIVLGELDFDTSRLPTGSGPGKKAVKLPARLHGRTITRADFSDWIDRTITLNVQCVSAWCGSVPRGEDMLMFLRQTGDSYTLDAGPCQGLVFIRPDWGMIDTARRCLRGGPCQPRH